jgi:hypothetical protein
MTERKERSPQNESLVILHRVIKMENGDWIPTVVAEEFVGKQKYPKRVWMDETIVFLGRRIKNYLSQNNRVVIIDTDKEGSSRKEIFVDLEDDPDDFYPVDF